MNSFIVATHIDVKGRREEREEDGPKVCYLLQPRKGNCIGFA